MQGKNTSGGKQMIEYPRSQDEYYDGMLRGFLMFAEKEKMILELIDDRDEKLDNYLKAMWTLNQLYDIIANIKRDGMFNESKKKMSIKVNKLLTEIINLEGAKLLNDFILN
jgi:hypothetical protein